MVPESEFAVCMPLCNFQSEDRNAKTGNVRCDVRSIRHDGDRLSLVATSDLDSYEDKGGQEDKSKLSCRQPICLH